MAVGLYIPPRGTGTSSASLTGEFVTLDTEQIIRAEKIFAAQVEIIASGDSALYMDTYVPSGYNELAWSYFEKPKFGLYTSFNSTEAAYWTTPISGKYWSLFGYDRGLDLLTVDICGNVTISYGNLDILTLSASNSGNFLTWDNTGTVINSGISSKTIANASGQAYTAAVGASATAYAYTVQASGTVYAITKQASATAYAYTIQASATAYSQAFNMVRGTSGQNNIHNFRSVATSAGSAILLQSNDNFVFVNSVTSSIGLVLPLASSQSRAGSTVVYTIKRIDSSVYSATVVPCAQNTLEGVSGQPYVLAALVSKKFASDGAGAWWATD